MCAHEIGVPFALTAHTMRVLVGDKKMPLMALSAGVRGTVLADNLRIPLALVGLKTNKAFLGHGDTNSNARGSHQF
jgi:hypothetical protein